MRYNLTILDMNPAYKNWSKNEILWNNRGKKAVLDAHRYTSKEDLEEHAQTIEVMWDQSVLLTHGAISLDRITLVDVVYKDENYIYKAYCDEDLPTELKKNNVSTQDLIKYVYENGLWLNIYDGSFHTIASVDDEGFTVNFYDSYNDKSYFGFDEIKFIKYKLKIKI